jgi:hypothetical protein
MHKTLTPSPLAAPHVGRRLIATNTAKPRNPIRETPIAEIPAILVNSSVVGVDANFSTRTYSVNSLGIFISNPNQRPGLEHGGVTENQGESLAVHGGDESGIPHTVHVGRSKQMF